MSQSCLLFFDRLDSLAIYKGAKPVAHTSTATARRMVVLSPPARKRPATQLEGRLLQYYIATASVLRRLANRVLRCSRYLLHR